VVSIFIQLAQSFGWHAHRCSASADLQDVFRQALAEEGPSLVVIPIDYAENLKLSRRLGEIEMVV